jgi:hypothetical protein
MRQFDQSTPTNITVGVAEPQPIERRVRAWNICAAVAIIWLAISPLIQESFQRSFRNGETSVPLDFITEYTAGYVASLKAPDNLLYYVPERRPWSFLELRTDATTPWGKLAQLGVPPVRYPYISPPLDAFLLRPLSVLPWHKAYFVWQLLCVLMMGASVYLALRLVQDGLPPAVMAAAIAVAFLFHPLRTVINAGNIDIAILFIWVLGVYALQRRNEFLSASCFALGTAIKFNPVLAVPLLALQRKWRWLLGYVLVSLSLLALSIGSLGWKNHLVWARQVAPEISRGISNFSNRSLPGFLFALGDARNLHMYPSHLPSWSSLGSVLSAIGYVGFLFWCWRQRKDSKALSFELILLPLIILLFSPYCWTLYYVLAIPILIHMWVRSRAPSANSTNLDLILLTASTMLIGSILPDAAALALGLRFELLLMGGWVAATGALMWVGMSMYKESAEVA